MSPPLQFPFHKPEPALPLWAGAGVLDGPIVKMAIIAFACIASSVLDHFKLHSLFSQDALDECCRRVASHAVNRVVLVVCMLGSLASKSWVIGIRTLRFQYHFAACAAGVPQRSLRIAQVIKYAEMDDEVDWRDIEWQLLVQVKLAGVNCRITSPDFRHIYLTSLKARHLRAEHGKEAANISITRAQLDDSFPDKELMPIVIEHGLDTFGLPFMVPQAEPLKFACQLPIFVEHPSFYSKAHNQKVRSASQRFCVAPSPPRIFRTTCWQYAQAAPRTIMGKSTARKRMAFTRHMVTACQKFRNP